MRSERFWRTAWTPAAGWPPRQLWTDDINKDWTSYLTYRSGSPTKLTPDEVPSAARYLTSSTRDFVACSVRA